MSNSVFQNVIMQLKEIGDRTFGVLDTEGCVVSSTDPSLLGERWVDAALKDCRKPITVAVMGCVVNGPGEAREADIGIAGGDGVGLIFEKGKQVAKLPYDQLLDALLERIQAL